MSQLSGKTVASIYQLSINYNARADTGSKSQHDEIFHTPCYAVCHFSYGSCVCIVSKCNWYAKFF